MRGANASWGANPGTKFFNNTAFGVLTGIACSDGCDASILEARNNIVIAAQRAYKGELFCDLLCDESHNVFGRLGSWGQYQRNGGDTKGTNTRYISPTDAALVFADPAAQKFDLRTGVTTTPWTKDMGSNAALSITYYTSDTTTATYTVTKDLAGKTTPVGTVDMGAFELP
ncbi:hypothetical protein [Deinococcus peraridilitoris]|uniref:Uncharacterized protein n=1 Tax=Deinococcus peraridilitoris (strain DSM 19664 / LMG 22246 / CIP 109416 / KR-200) TaxID=937777 RepID=L0A344_DEIPD|nr:hypothetical protein [Deinococcus peraridilitoris]AFZ67587.1 hypothetical protein Deipe_2092 [Deinococcus peraridilitoris DSM 19664]